jgi:hypothetical protein
MSTKPPREATRRSSSSVLFDGTGRRIQTSYFDRHSTYVAMSRHRQSATLHLRAGGFPAALNLGLRGGGDKAILLRELVKVGDGGCGILLL